MLLNCKKFSLSSLRAPLLAGLLLVGPHASAQSHVYVTPAEKALLAQKKADADQMIEDFFQRALKELRPEILEMAAPHGQNIKNLISYYLDVIDHFYKIDDSEIASIIQAMGYLHDFKGTLVPSDLVKSIFKFFADNQALDEEHEKAISDWFENQLKGVMIDVNSQGLVVLSFVPKVKGRDMRLKFSEGDGEDDAKIEIKLSAKNSFVFKNRDVKSRWGKTEYGYTDIKNFFSNRGLLTDKMDLISLSKEDILSRLDVYARSQAAKLPPLFMTIKGFKFSVENSGVPGAGLLSPSIDRVVVLPNFSEMAPANYRARRTYVRFNTIVNGELEID